MKITRHLVIVLLVVAALVAAGFSLIQIWSETRHLSEELDARAEEARTRTAATFRMRTPSEVEGLLRKLLNLLSREGAA